MELTVSAVFKMVDESGETIANVKSTLNFDVCNSTKSASKKDIYKFLKSKVPPMGGYLVEDMNKEELEQYKKEEEV